MRGSIQAGYSAEGLVALTTVAGAWGSFSDLL